MKTMKSPRLPPIPLRVTPWGDDLLKLVPERMIPEATKHMRNGLGLISEWPKDGASIKEIHDDAWGAWVGIMNALEIAYGACSLDRSKELFARIETSDTPPPLKGCGFSVHLDQFTTWTHPRRGCPPHCFKPSVQDVNGSV